MHLVASIISCQFQELIGYLSVNFGEAPGSNVADILDGAYLEPFKQYSIVYSPVKPAC